MYPLHKNIIKSARVEIIYNALNIFQRIRITQMFTIFYLCILDAETDSGVN